MELSLVFLSRSAELVARSVTGDKSRVSSCIEDCTWETMGSSLVLHVCGGGRDELCHGPAVRGSHKCTGDTSRQWTIGILLLFLIGHEIRWHRLAG